MNIAEKMRMETEKKKKMSEQAQREFVNSVRDVMAKKGYRADLVLVGSMKSGDYDYIEIKYNTDLGYPTEKDLMSLVSNNFKNRSIDWGTVSVDSDEGTISINLAASVDVIPLESISKIPPSFVSIGTALYRRALDSSGDTHEIWSLKKDENGDFALYKNCDDIETTAESGAENEFIAGDIVDTEYGPGKIIRFDDLGNAIVLVGSKRHLVAADEMQTYNVDKEKQKLIDYFTQAYGDPNFAKALVEKY